MSDLKDIETAYAQIISGYAKPGIMWMNGKHLKEFAAAQGDVAVVDHDGNPILDGECYMLTKEGIFLYNA